MTDMINVVIVRGIGEKVGHGILQNIVNKLDSGKFYCSELYWGAGYGPVPKPMGSSFEINLLEGHHDLDTKILLLDGPIVLVGYSGGAQLVGDYVAAASKFTLSRILGVVLIADPSMPVMPGTSGKHGIRGPRKLPESVTVKWYAHPRDAIALCRPNRGKNIYPLRRLAKASANFSLAVRGSWDEALNGLVTGPSLFERIRSMNDLEGLKKDYENAWNDVNGYLFRGDHTSYHTRKLHGNDTYTDDAARWITSLAN